MSHAYTQNPGSFLRCQVRLLEKDWMARSLTASPLLPVTGSGLDRCPSADTMNHTWSVALAHCAEHFPCSAHARLAFRCAWALPAGWVGLPLTPYVQLPGSGAS